ncbi:MAG TPA: hypothetical protein VGO45_00355 [Bacteroidia bacterium]|jgi:hypothetical protein|nr:hypothetical protein [Bacteroidia bacterium]
MKSIVITIFFCLSMLNVSFAHEKTDSVGAKTRQRYYVLFVGNAVKTGLGTTFVGIGYKPSPEIEFYVAPSWGVFTGGTAVFAVARANILSKYKLFPNVELAFRHSSRTVVSYENHDSGGQESYRIPPSEYLVGGLGLNYARNQKDSADTPWRVSIAATYSYALADYHYGYLSGPFSASGEDGAYRKLSSGWGFTLTFSVIMGPVKRKKK